MKSYVTSYNGLFARRSGEAPIVDRIEIPIIQRDYAQGRTSEAVGRIRSNFLDVLHDAVTTGAPVSLDFVYGDVDVDTGTLRPLDGQQRLTTLFLLHWYLAWRADRLDEDLGWKRFSYATRPSARRFCERLVDMTQKPAAHKPLRAWFEDQHWFLYTWQHDPTIQSMLKMLEAIHERFADTDCAAAWNRLVDPVAPAISFHLLPIEQMGLSEDLYIKMNSRGKALTLFENFKARFEQVLEASCPERVEEFAQKVDGAWARLLWPLKGSDNTVDDEFLRYFRFVTEVCEWHDGRLPSDDIEAMAVRVYGTANKEAAAHLDFLLRSFDTWVGPGTASVFSEVFSLTPAPLDAEDTSKVVLYGMQGTSINLFAECCLGKVRRSWPRTLLLYAVLLHRLHATEEFPRRLRMLRNLIEASGSWLRADMMPGLIGDVRRLVIKGDISTVSSFNPAQVADEELKIEFLRTAPHLQRVLFHLEDHFLLRGSLAVFDLDAEKFERRARAFNELFPDEDTTVLPVLTGALLAAGDYSYSRRTNRRFSKLGSSSSMAQWREKILTGATRAHLADVRDALGRLLDALGERDGDVRSTLKAFTQTWLASVEVGSGLDWRWYFVRYPEMRAGTSGIYASPDWSTGYNACMLEKQAMQSYYRDPYLSAILLQSKVAATAVIGAIQEWSGLWFSGHETKKRWMRLVASGTMMRCASNGLELRAPAGAAHAEEFQRVCTAHGVGPDLRLVVPQVNVGQRQLDTQDRVLRGAALLRDLVNAGL